MTISGRLVRAALFSPSLCVVAHAQVSLSDRGTTAPTVFDTGFTGPFDNRYSFDGPISPATTPADSHGQSFTPLTTGALDRLHLAYNAGGTGSFRLYVDANYAGGGGTEIVSDATAAGNVFVVHIADFLPLPANLSGTSADVNGSPVYWMQLDLSNEGIALTSGQPAAFFIAAIGEVASDSNFIFAPHYKQTTNAYADGTAIGGANFSPPANSDFGFAVTVDTSDTDGDGLPDSWELGFPAVTGLGDLNGAAAGPGPGAATGDFDGDGLNDLAEFTQTTDPTVADSDGDGLSDGQEIDGRNASGVVHGFGPTEPKIADTDGDGVNDGCETGGLDAAGESHGFGATHPHAVDSDSDGMDDLYEVTCRLNGGLNPNADDAAGNLDGDSGNALLGTASFSNIDEYFGSYTNGIRTRADQPDTDDDGRADTVEDGAGLWSGPTLTGTRPDDADSDNDGLEDGDENPDLAFPGAGILPTNADPSLADTDTDTLGDALEVTLGTNPAAADTDGDTHDDLVELLNGSDPKLASSVPSSTDVKAGTDFTALPWLQIGGGVTKEAGSPFFPGSGESARITANTNNAGAMVAFANPGGTAYYSIDLRYTGTLDGQGFNVLSGNLAAVQTSANTHCGVRFLPDGSIGYFNGGTFTADAAPAGSHVAGHVYTVQFTHDIAANAYTIRVYDRSAGEAVVFAVTPAVPTRNQTPGATLYFGAGIQQDSTAGFELRLDNLYVSTAPIAPGTGEPAAPPLVTAVFFDAGDLKITFSPGGSGYVLTSSHDLSAPFAAEPAATYDGVSTFTVPAAALNPGRDFFRVETAP